MPIDASIPMGFRGIKLDNPLTNYAQYQQIRSGISQNKLADLTMGQKQAEIESANALSRAFADAVKEDGTVDRNVVRANLAKGGQGSVIPDVNTQFSAEDKAALEATDAQLKTALNQMSYVSQALSGATPENYAQVVQGIAAINPKAASNLPPAFDAAAIQGLIRSGIPIAEQLKQKAAEAAAQLAAANAEANRGVVIRGQDMASRDRQAALDAKVNAPKRPVALSATAQKELFEADDTVQSSKAVIGLLDKAITLNDKAYSGYAAGERAKLRSNLPGESDQANATVDLNNIITGQALESLKAVFGGMPTEGERAILMDMQASVDKTPKQRAAIIERAKTAAERRLKFNEEKAKGLRDGSYMTEGAQEADDGDIFSQADAILGGM